jgi:hypothetical protein
LGASLTVKPNGLEVVYVYDTSGVLAAPDSPLSETAVDLRPGDVVTRVDGVFLNATDQPLSRALLGKAGMQVLLEVDQKPREAEDDDEQEIVAQLTQGMMPWGDDGPDGHERRDGHDDGRERAGTVRSAGTAAGTPERASRPAA